MTFGWQAKYDPWGSSRAVIDMQNEISDRHGLTETQAREVGNIIHTLTFHGAYRVTEMSAVFDRIYGDRR